MMMIIVTIHFIIMSSLKFCFFIYLISEFLELSGNSVEHMLTVNKRLKFSFVFHCVLLQNLASNNIFSN